VSQQGEVQEAGVQAAQLAGRGFFVTLEGIDRSGKTTQVERLCASLAARGLPVGVAGVPGGSLREPGGTPAGEAIRDVLLHRPNEIAPWTEALLYAAARAQLVSELLRPSLEAGLIVVLDRYVDSSLAYQGFARGLGMDAVLEVNQRATGGLLPDLTLLLRVDPDRAARRAGGPPDRLEAEGRALQARVAAGYDELARRYPERIVALDGERPAAAVAADVERATLAALDALTAAPAPVAPGSSASPPAASPTARSGHGVR
jgi:dTMP kinase